MPIPLPPDPAIKFPKLAIELTRKIDAQTTLLTVAGPVLANSIATFAKLQYTVGPITPSIRAVLLAYPADTALIRLRNLYCPGIATAETAHPFAAGCAELNPGILPGKLSGLLSRNIRRSN